MAQGQPSSVTVIAGPWKGRRFDLPLYPADVVIGSDSACSIVLPLPGVAPQHATLRNVAEGTWILDAGAPAGLFVNGERVSEYRPLLDGDVLSLGPSDGQGVQMACHLIPLGQSSEASPADGGEAAPPVDVSIPEQAEPVVEALDAGSAEVPAPFVADPLGDEGFFVEESSPVEVEPGPQPAEAPLAAGDFFVEEESPVDAAAGGSESGAPGVAPVEAIEVGQDPTVVEEAFFVGEEPVPAVFPPDSSLEEDFFVSEPPAVEAPPVPPVPPAASKAVPPPLTSGRAAGPVASSAPRASAPPAGGSRDVRGQADSPPAPTLPRPRPAPRSMPAAARPQPPRAAGMGARGGAVRRPPRRGGNRLAVSVGIGALVVGVLGYGLAGWLRRPVVTAIDPSPARVGEAVTLKGERLGGGAQVPVVLFDGRPGSVESASPESIVVRVPDLQLPSGQEVAVPVKVKAGGPFSANASVMVRQVPQIDGLSPDVAVSGEEVVVGGGGWGAGAVQVTFNGVPAQVLATEPTYIRVRVPGLAVSQGTIVQVTVSNGKDVSNAAELIFGRAPVVVAIEPREAAAGDRIVVRGRGFRADPSGQAVRVGGVPALVVEAGERALTVVFPTGVAPGEATLDVRVQGSPNVAVGVVTSKPLEAQIRANFVAEPYVDSAGHDHAQLATPLGPLMILSAAGGQTAGQRAVKAAASLDKVLEKFRTSLDADLELRLEDGNAVIALTGGEALLQVTPEDAGGYSEGWGGRATPVSASRLANWWLALIHDYALVATRFERPHFTAALAAEGRSLAVAFDTMERVGRGLSVAGVSALTPQERESLRILALRVPSSVPEPQPLRRAPSAVSATAPTGTPSTHQPLKLDGEWRGFEQTSTGRRNITVSFDGPTGAMSMESGVTVSMPMLSVEPGRNGVSFSVRESGGRLYYAGKWNGERIVGTIGDHPGGTEVGTFELWRR